MTNTSVSMNFCQLIAAPGKMTLFGIRWRGVFGGLGDPIGQVVYLKEAKYYFILLESIDISHSLLSSM